MFPKYAAAAVLIAVASAALGQPPPAPSAPSGPPAPALGSSARRVLNIAPGQSAVSRRVARKLTLGAGVPDDLQAEVVVFYIDDREVGRSNERPYRIEWDSADVKDGEHAVRWSALGSDRGELASGSVTLVVSNEAGPEPRGPARGPVPAPNGPSTGPPAVTPPIAAPEYVRYSDPKYGISIEHPSAWSVKDQSSSLPRGWIDGYWLVLATDPVAKATHVVNVRHRLLQREHTPQSFVKYTPYVSTWERTTISGHPAFVTMSGTPSAKRVVHRAMILGGRHLWMINCLDTSGKSPSESKAVFMRVVESLGPSGELAPSSGAAGAEG